jgi:hypothetical protein
MKTNIFLAIMGSVAIAGIIAGFFIGTSVAANSREEVLLCKKRPDTGEVSCKALQDWNTFFSENPSEVGKWLDSGYTLP